jgi:hypothetical protein
MHLRMNYAMVRAEYLVVEIDTCRFLRNAPWRLTGPCDARAQFSLVSIAAPGGLSYGSTVLDMTTTIPFSVTPSLAQGADVANQPVTWR